MALIMYLTKAPRYQNIVTDEYETIPRDDIVLIDKYFNWKRAKAEGKNSGNTLEEWCGIPESKLASTYVVNHYSNFYDKKNMYHEHMGYIETYSVFDQLARIVKANQIFNWFINNVTNGAIDDNYYDVSKDNLENLLSACNNVINGIINNDNHLIVDEVIAHEILPIMEQRGLFFGVDSYNEIYAQQVIEVSNIVNHILETTDFEKETVYFNAIW